MSPVPVASEGCLACRIVAGEVVPPGGILWRGGGLVVHALAGPCPVPGWMVITSERHVRALYDLDGAELAAVSPLAARVMRAQLEVLGAEHAYAFAIGDVLQHFHLHVVPRFADTPERLRGRGAFDARPEDALPEERVASAVVALAAAVRGN